MDDQDILLLAQLVDAIKDAEKRLEEYYNKGDIENFNSAKLQILDFRKKIADILK